MSRFVMHSFIFFALFLTLFGCGKSSTKSMDSYSTVTVSGTVNLEPTVGILKAASVDSTNYMIWAQNRASRRVYFSDLASTGEFSLPIEVKENTVLGDNFIFCLIQKDPLEFSGVITKEVSPNSSFTFSSGFIIGKNTTDFEADFDLDKYQAVMPSSVSYIDVDESLKVRFSNSRHPVGADNAGKGSASLTSSPNASNTIDRDEDGVPDIFDAMNDGADLDNKDSDNQYESAIFSDTLNSVVMFMNLKVDEEFESSYTVTDDAIVVIEARSDVPSTITSIEADLMHASFKSAKLDRVPGGFTAIDSGHTENAAWLQSGTYKLYKMQNASGDIVWTVLLKPGNNDFGPGSLVRLKVTLTDGSVEYYFTTINFKFSTIVDHTTTGFVSGAGTRSNPYVVPATGNVTLTWTAPKDEDGSDLTDLDYSFEFFYYDNATPENQIGDRGVQTIGTDVYTADIPSASIDLHASSTPSPSSMQVDITCRYPYGDNSANKIYIKRQGWP